MKPFFATCLLLLFASFMAVKGQSLTASGNDLNRTDHVRLEPQRSVEYTIKTDRCLLFVSDFLTRLTLPFDKTFEWKIPAGTKFRVPAGKYLLANNSSSTLEFKLTSIDECAQS